MRKCKVYLENIPGSPYSQSAQHETPFLDREQHDAYDERTWREKCTTTPEGDQVAIPAMALKQCIDTSARKVGMKVKGRGASTYKNFFPAGVICSSDVPLTNGGNKPLLKSEVTMVKISCNPQGQRAGGKRVPRRFPMMPKWSGVAEFVIVDDIITPEVFEHHMATAGIVVGIGRFRPENGGTNGRFRVTKFEWENFQI